MSIFSNTDDPAASKKDAALPADQQKRAEQAQLTPDGLATQAEAGTPQYGSFGKADEVEPVKNAHNDGSNDNPDEFSEFRKDKTPTPDDTGTNSQSANLENQRGHVDQNQDPQAVRKVQNADADEQRSGWADDDERYAGGHRQASWEENNNEEHSND
ncbi:MAG: hypothetical protein ACRYG7_12695 [Janthinobacterium lividum]